jgi:hypothetical protein
VEPDGKEVILYRAIDHWKELKPPTLKERDLNIRMAKLKIVSLNPSRTSVEETLGEADSSMGSGIDYRLYYLEDGPAVLAFGYPEALEQTVIERPGGEPIPLADWQKLHRTASQKNAPTNR